jgi:hypothetical protein
MRSMRSVRSVQYGRGLTPTGGFLTVGVRPRRVGGHMWWHRVAIAQLIDRM